MTRWRQRHGRVIQFGLMPTKLMLFNLVRLGVTRADVCG
ncbi:hypothetical protein PAJL_1868 [Cutibacterium acnes HL042PA3]|nr:hypothetical protein PAJL_1868 [Cutibacterium acnes HL042PA3]KEY37019.1 hypothetical protein FB33_1595 [Cutibacterium acnes]KFE37192.1 hypothetical protein FB41_2391 [Cutibacterium acnes]MCW5107314.1 hypothetical protein [Cutibacterium acnes P07A]